MILSAFELQDQSNLTGDQMEGHRGIDSEGAVRSADPSSKTIRVPQRMRANSI